jgi:DNA replication protein DnaC
MKALLKPEFPRAFRSPEEYESWRASLSEREARERERAVELLRGIPMRRYEGVAPAPWRGGLLHGPAGVGKTREAIARLLPTSRGIFYEAHEFIEDARALEMDRGTDLQERRNREAFRAAHFVLDDLGARRPTQFAEDATLRLVNHRWKERLETLVTSNMSPLEIAETWGDRIASRIAGFGAVEAMNGPDKRIPKP